VTSLQKLIVAGLCELMRQRCCHHIQGVDKGWQFMIPVAVLDVVKKTQIQESKP